MVYYDEGRKVYSVFWFEYHTSNIFDWKEFIDLKDLGIRYIKRGISNDLYNVVDEKKWLLAKIKYGI
jgi:hypothetical protein